MSTSRASIVVADLNVEVVRKAIKNLHISVLPPNGDVRVAAPIFMDDEAIRRSVMLKLPWIRRHQRNFVEQERLPAREYVSGESHWVDGYRYLLTVIEQPGTQRVVVRNKKHLDLYVRPGSTLEQRRALLHRWHRQRLRGVLAPLVEKWQQRMGVTVAFWGIKVMRTRWGTCNPVSARVWFNLELAGKPNELVEYIVVHELAHLLEPTHNERFTAYMDKFLPGWRQRKDALNRLPYFSV